jgi:hypothetical protein
MTHLTLNSHGHLRFVNKDLVNVSDISKHSLSSTTTNHCVIHSTLLRILFVLELQIMVYSSKEKVDMLLIYGGMWKKKIGQSTAAVRGEIS